MPKPVILDHDGGHDDLVALALLLTQVDKVNVIGCVVIDGDCFVDEAFDVTGKLMCLVHDLKGTPVFPIGRSTFRGVNPFPTEWRYHSHNMNSLPAINMLAHRESWEKLKPANEPLVGEQLLADLVMKSPEKVTICVTGPLSNVAWCINTYGEAFTKNVEEVVIMGGALRVKGNVFLPTTDGTAEWNIYWDPSAAKTVFSCPTLRCVVFALDATNHVPVNASVVQRFGAQNEFFLSQFVGSSWAMCTHYEVMRPGDGYFAWDVLTAAYIIDSSICDLEEVLITVETAKVPGEGRTFTPEDSSHPKVFFAKDTKAEQFYDLILSSCRFC